MADERPEVDPERAAEDLRESLFDAYLDAVRQGTDESAAAFLARHGVRDTTLADRLDAIRDARGAFAATSDPWIGKVLGGFRIETLLGEGGMGLVYQAVDVELDRRVAIKLLRPEVAGASAAQARFEREARAIARLRHPHIVPLLSLGQAEGVRYLVLELVAGTPLDILVRREREAGRSLASERVVRWARQIADALECAHANGIVHRDVKASNVLIADADDAALLVDFGIARSKASPGEARDITLTGAIVGSPYAMAPERIGRQREGALHDDPLSDVYGVGILLWECLAGRAPFEAESIERVFSAILHDPPPRLRSVAPNVSRDLETVTMKAIEKLPHHRYASAAALRDDLDALLAFRPIAARPDGALRSLARRAHRHRMPIALGLGATFLGASLLVAQRIAINRERQAAADQTLDEATAHVESLRRAVDAAYEIESRRSLLAPTRFERHLTDAEDREFDAVEREAAERRSERDAHVDEAIELLAAAERLGAAPERTRRLRQALYVVQYEDARKRDDIAGAATLKRLIREHDPDGSVIAALDRGTRLEVSVVPASAALHLYRMVDAREVRTESDPRLVPAPYRTPSELPAGTWAIEVLAKGSRLAPHDCIVAIDGRPVGEEMFRERALPAGTHEGWLANASTVDRVTDRGAERVELDASDRSLRCSLTTRPLPRVASAAIAPGDFQLTVGDYLLVADAPGHDTIRVPLTSRRNDRATFVIRLPEAGAAPPGFLPLPALDVPREEVRVDAWIMERELTVAEYLAFVNDPATLEAIALAQESVHVPRSLTEGVHCPRGPDGRYGVPGDWRAEWPVLGISWDDAVAYVAWRNQRGQAAGEPWVYALPTLSEWTLACAPAPGTEFVTGSEWRPKWVSSVFAFERPTPAPVTSFPRDESALGVRDLMGSVSEYLDEWWRQDVGHRKHAGGSWAYGDLNSFRFAFANGRPPGSPSDTAGIRLVARRRSTPP